jgi:hypothetical protein
MKWIILLTFVMKQTNQFDFNHFSYLFEGFKSPIKDSNDYDLITPTDKYMIEVDDAPYVLLQVDTCNDHYTLRIQKLCN